MSWGIVGGAVVGYVVGSAFSGDDDATAAASQQGAATQAQATIRGAEIAAKSQREALEYLKEREKLPREISEKALRGLSGIYGGVTSQQDLIDKAMSSPLYRSIVGGREAGEEAILRNVAATGGLRSGNVQQNLYDYNTQLENKALLESYNQQLQGLTGLAGLPSNARYIAGATAGIGQTLGAGQAQAGQIYGQGIIGAAQSEQASQQQMINNLLGVGSLALMFSDRRLKKNIKQIGIVNGWNWYEWEWNIVAQKMGLKGNCQGVMADEVYQTNPEAVTMKNYFMMVDYSKLEVCNG